MIFKIIFKNFDARSLSVWTVVGFILNYIIVHFLSVQVLHKTSKTSSWHSERFQDLSLLFRLLIWGKGKLQPTQKNEASKITTNHITNYKDKQQYQHSIFSNIQNSHTLFIYSNQHWVIQVNHLLISDFSTRRHRTHDTRHLLKVLNEGLSIFLTLMHIVYVSSQFKHNILHVMSLFFIC